MEKLHGLTLTGKVWKSISLPPGYQINVLTRTVNFAWLTTCSKLWTDAVDAYSRKHKKWTRKGPASFPLPLRISETFPYQRLWFIRILCWQVAKLQCWRAGFLGNIKRYNWSPSRIFHATTEHTFKILNHHIFSQKID